jgi:hypothetical protein
MKIQLLKPYGMAKVGDILPNVNKPVAEQLILRNIAKKYTKKRKKNAQD